jgi:hypothetical protein
MLACFSCPATRTSQCPLPATKTPNYTARCSLPSRTLFVSLPRRSFISPKTQAIRRAAGGRCGRS